MPDKRVPTVHRDIRPDSPSGHPSSITPWRDTLTSQERHEIERAERIGALRPVEAGPNNLLPKLARMLDQMEAMINGDE